MSANTVVTTVAFYLPQFHPVRFNDENWSPGFTDWINVARARPLFEGHAQPRLPGLLGFYDLRCPEVMAEQADLARTGGVDAFCFYYYRFGSQRLLEQPLESFLAHPEIDISFLYCWANEPWTKAWDGRSGETILPQDYDDHAFAGLVQDLTRAMSDPRYLRVQGRPAFLIYQIEQLPDPAKFIERLRRSLKSALDLEPFIGAVYSHGFKVEMLEWLDFVVQFPPHRMPRDGAGRSLLSAEDVNAFDPSRMDKFESYEAVVSTALSVGDVPKMLLGTTPDWDNSPRRPREAHVLVGSSPEQFHSWVEQATVRTLERFEAGVIPAPMMFVNAWNEWGEGAMLEPSLALGDAYLRALKQGIDSGTERFLSAQA